MPVTYQPAMIHAQLDARFYRAVAAAKFPQHILRYRNDQAAQTIGLDGLNEAEWIAHFGAFQPMQGNFPEPLALCYHGHQFGHYNPDLGDGRGFLFAQMQANDGRILDLGTKGSGQTPFSRTADGRLTLKGAVREILATELLTALGVNTSKTFSVIETGEALQRNDEPSPTRSAVMVRLSHSHIRIGSFQRLNYLDDAEGLEMLVRHVARHYYAEMLDAEAPIAELAPELLTALGVNTSKTFSVIETGEALQRNDEPSPTRSAVMVRLSHSHIRIGSFQRLNYLDDAEGLEMLVRHVARHYYAEMLDAEAPIAELAPELLGVVGQAIATTAGQWLAAGFVHGVLNTDNFNVTGESFDYGPWRFLPRFDPNLTAAYFDQTSRYAYGRQADAALWAVCRLADCFIRFCPQSALEEKLGGFFEQMEASLAVALAYRLGVAVPDDTADAAALCRSLFTAARTTDVWFDQIFHDHYGGQQRRGAYVGAEWDEFHALLRACEGQKTHAFFDREIAVSLVIDEVEAIWAPIAADDDWSALTAKLDDIRALGAALRA